MTASSIKEVLDDARAYISVQVASPVSVAILKCIDAALATLSPPAGERREAIALQIYNDRLKRRGETTVTMENVNLAKARGFDILAMDRPTAAAILATLSPPAGERREAIARLAARFWSIHPKELQDMGITREQFYTREMTAILTSGFVQDEAAIRKDEREKCVKIADEHRSRVPGHDPDVDMSDKVAQGYGNAAFNIAAAIRRLASGKQD